MGERDCCGFHIHSNAQVKACAIKDLIGVNVTEEAVCEIVIKLHLKILSLHFKIASLLKLLLVGEDQNKLSTLRKELFATMLQGNRYRYLQISLRA